MLTDEEAAAVEERIDPDGPAVLLSERDQIALCRDAARALLADRRERIEREAQTLAAAQARGAEWWRALYAADEVMATWFSGEYADHPKRKAIVALLNAPADTAALDTALAEARALAEIPERLLRVEWWLHHGCPSVALYGDDGELQCSACMTDFKRTPFAELRQVVSERRLQAAAAEQDVLAEARRQGAREAAARCVAAALGTLLAPAPGQSVASGSVAAAVEAEAARIEAGDEGRCAADGKERTDVR